GISHKRLQGLGLEYRFVSLYLQKKLSKPELTEKLRIAIQHYAKRQETWFKKNPSVSWVSARNARKTALRLSKKFLRPLLLPKEDGNH
ncbi:MAG: hypothetical protein HYW88_02520, partial [Candidatus Sungbacteria bacterium]|nr:hypothetical protein [Candidatus Sungbacteria bacterium]